MEQITESVFSAAVPDAAEKHQSSSQTTISDGLKTSLSRHNDTANLVNAPVVIEADQEYKASAARRWWVRLTWLLTWWIPSFTLAWAGKRRPDVQMAWREKVAICLLIVLLWAMMMFYIIGLTLILCPKQYVYTVQDVSVHLGLSDLYSYMYGVVYDISSFTESFHDPRKLDTLDQKLVFGGGDMGFSFPVPINYACPGLLNVTQDTFLASNNTVIDGRFVHTSGPQTNRPDTDLTDPKWFYDMALPTLRLNRIGSVVWEASDVNAMRQSGLRWSIINKRVYNLEPYFATLDLNPAQGAGTVNYNFLDNSVTQLFNEFAFPTDLTAEWAKYIPARVAVSNLHCMDQLFYVGNIDERQSLRCLFPYYLLLASTALIGLVILIKFLAALQLTGRRLPQLHDRFVICQVPCYTESEESLRRTINSLAELDYDDKHKLIFVICDGMIIGSGNDRPTPRIVLDIFGIDPSHDPEPRAFQSIGEGSKQYNRAQVFSGLYEREGHEVPFIVVAKIGGETEKARPGNRGKRDSQIVLMRFLNRVHRDTPMAPVELDIYHHMKNVIGVHPSLYEFVLMIDADTVVSNEALRRLIASMVHDSRICGICGETRLTNEDFSFTTMIQVYEYYISHHLTKAFESLFGSVTCLPGCFCMYRIRTTNGKTVLIVSDNVVNDYAENRVDTLHKKNLLSLGEDRYLTTLMMKHFPNYKMKFASDAWCSTTAPEKWEVLLSQRRRWINSTVHNLAELMFLPDMCGFCVFSMRFVVFLDLFGTLTSPATVIYLGYLLYLVVSKTSQVGVISLIILGAVYGLQAVIFILKRQWQHIGWMIFYLLGMPLFSFFIPIYAFWHFDDFSWGNTRLVVGENKKKMLVSDEGVFDPKTVPLQRWSEYEQEMMMYDGEDDEESLGSHHSHATSHHSHAASHHSHAASHHSHAASHYSYYHSRPASSVEQPPLQLQGYGSNRPSVVLSSGLAYASQPVMRPMSAMSGGIQPQPARPTSHFSQMQPYDDPRYSTTSMGQYDLQGPYLSMHRPISTVSVGNQGGLMRRVYADPSQASSPAHSSGGNSIGDYPGDDVVLAGVRDVLSQADLMTVTKRQVRDALSEQLNYDLTPHKQFVNQCIERVLREAQPQ